MRVDIIMRVEGGVYYYVGGGVRVNIRMWGGRR